MCQSLTHRKMVILIIWIAAISLLLQLGKTIQLRRRIIPAQRIWQTKNGSSSKWHGRKKDRCHKPPPLQAPTSHKIKKPPCWTAWEESEKKSHCPAWRFFSFNYTHYTHFFLDINVYNVYNVIVRWLNEIQRTRKIASRRWMEIQKRQGFAPSIHTPI